MSVSDHRIVVTIADNGYVVELHHMMDELPHAIRIAETPDAAAAQVQTLLMQERSERQGVATQAAPEASDGDG